MRRDQLEHAIRAACQIIDHAEVIVVGSQAILGTYDEDELPAAATMSIEVDILPIADSNEETARLADLIEGVAGEFSSFEQLHGFSIDGVDLDTAVLPDSWRDRLVRVQNANTAAPAGEPRFTGNTTYTNHSKTVLRVCLAAITTGLTRRRSRVDVRLCSITIMNYRTREMRGVSVMIEQARSSHTVAVRTGAIAVGVVVGVGLSSFGLLWPWIASLVVGVSGSTLGRGRHSLLIWVALGIAGGALTYIVLGLALSAFSEPSSGSGGG